MLAHGDVCLQQARIDIIRPTNKKVHLLSLHMADTPLLVGRMQICPCGRHTPLEIRLCSPRNKSSSRVVARVSQRSTPHRTILYLSLIYTLGEVVLALAAWRALGLPEL